MEFKLHHKIHTPEKQPFLSALSHYNLKGCFTPPFWSHRVCPFSFHYWHIILLRPPLSPFSLITTDSSLFRLHRSYSERAQDTSANKECSLRWDWSYGVTFSLFIVTAINFEFLPCSLVRAVFVFLFALPPLPLCSFPFILFPILLINKIKTNFSLSLITDARFLVLRTVV